jgi:hypothetical protein
MVYGWDMVERAAARSRSDLVEVPPSMLDRRTTSRCHVRSVACVTGKMWYGSRMDVYSHGPPDVQREAANQPDGPLRMPRITGT